MKFIFIDLEFNCIEFKRSKFKKSKNTGKILMNELMQSSIVVTDENFNSISNLNLYVKPTLTEKVNTYVANVTKLDEHKLNNIGLPLEEVCKQIKNFIDKYNENATIITWGGNDVSILKDNFEACGVSLKKELTVVDLQIIFANKYQYYDEYNVMKFISLVDAGIISGISFRYEDAHNANVDTDLTIKIAKTIGTSFILDENNQKMRIKAQNSRFQIGNCFIKYKPMEMGDNMGIKYNDIWYTIKLKNGYKDKIKEIVRDDDLTYAIFLEMENIRNIEEENGILTS